MLQDSVTGIVKGAPGAAPRRDDSGAGADAAEEEERAGQHGGLKHTLHLDTLGEAVIHAAERAAEALRIASEDGTRGTP